VKKKRLKTKSKSKPKEMTLRQKRIIRTKEKVLLKKEINNRAKKKRVITASTKKTEKPTGEHRVGCGGCRRKKRKI